MKAAAGNENGKLMNRKTANADAAPTTESAGERRRHALGVWLYAVTDSRTPDASALPPGVAGEPLRRIGAGALTAVVGTVDLADFGEQALRRNLEDLDWLAAAARAHDRVVHAVTEGGAPVLPIGLATVFADDENVRALLEARCDELAVALEGLAGRTEWGVKAYLDPAAARTRAGEKGGTDPAGRGGAAKESAEPGAGTAFLARRRAQLDQQRSAARLSAQRADRIHARLAGLSAGCRRYAPQDPALTGRRDQMLLNGAYLVDDRRLDAFRSAVAAIGLEARRDGVHVELTGPWPSYSFAAQGLSHG